MTKPMRSTSAYEMPHSKLVQEVRSAPVEAVEDMTAAPYIHTLLSAVMAVCALPRSMFCEPDTADIRNVRLNLARLLERVSP